MTNFTVMADSLFTSFRKAVLAGLFISIGCIVNLKVGGAIGAFLFSFGLLSVVLYGVPLYTGKAGFCSTVDDLKRLCVILLGNVVGAFLLAVCVHFCFPEVSVASENILSYRLSSDVPRAVLSSILCGFVMTTVVRFARRTKSSQDNQKYDGNLTVLLLGIPLFILSGYWHSIADTFYYAVCLTFSPRLIVMYLITVVGNFIGCNLYNIVSCGTVFVRDK